MARSKAQRHSGAAATPRQSSMSYKVPLNDDREEKASRLQSRQALHEATLSSIRSAATPNKKRLSGAGSNPRTPADGENVVIGEVRGSAITPLKKQMPIMGNFEDWIKMATDGKINANNAWNFALIDAFYDMNVLKEGDGVNFQKASCTLDGCVKIYNHRVDGLGTETGKLLSGLADSGNKKRDRDVEDGEDGEEEEEGEEGTKKKKKRTQRSHEATCVPSFDNLQLKKMELEFSVDPLFKKASADFDEGGAKGLLLNNLAIDSQGRIVFDSSDDAQAEAPEEGREGSEGVDAGGEVPTSSQQTEQGGLTENPDIDISALGAKYFPDLSLLEEQDICPSLKNLDLGDPTGSLDLPFLKAPEDWRQEKEKGKEGEEDDNDDARSGIFLDGDNALGLDDDDDLGLGALDMPSGAGFGEGGEALAKEVALEPQMRPHDITIINGDGENEEVEMSGFGVTLQHGRAEDHENILNYFDQALQKNWAGPEHWKIKRIKDLNKASTTPAPKRKEKEPFQIDFAAPMSQDLATALYTEAASNQAISLPKSQWKSKNRNLLPDDKHFNSQQLRSLFLKPKARTNAKRSSEKRPQQPQDEEMDEAYWAHQNNIAENEPEAREGDYDADFFQDDPLPLADGPLDDDEEAFADAQEHLSPGPGGEDGPVMPMDGMIPSTQDQAFGTQLVTQSRRLRPEYVQYARVAKKVDVRRLKENIWRKIGWVEPTGEPQSDLPTPPIKPSDDGSLRFTELINSLRELYSEKSLSDISTSYCFICLLHLANEKGLIISNEKDFLDLIVRRDANAELTDEGAV